MEEDEIDESRDEEVSFGVESGVGGARAAIDEAAEVEDTAAEDEEEERGGDTSVTKSFFGGGEERGVSTTCNSLESRLAMRDKGSSVTETRCAIRGESRGVEACESEGEADAEKEVWDDAVDSPGESVNEGESAMLADVCT